MPETFEIGDLIVYRGWDGGNEPNPTWIVKSLPVNSETGTVFVEASRYHDGDIVKFTFTSAMIRKVGGRDL